MDPHARRRWLAACAGVLFLPWAPSALAGDAGCVRHDLGPLSICVPLTWQLIRDGIDSAAGRFTAEGLQLRYDFGLHADPLRVPPAATDVHEGTTTVEGLPARRVRYALRQGEGLPMHYLGVHVPQIRHTRMGWLRLTLLAYAHDPQRFGDVDAAASTVQVKPAPTR